ncbi:hypothetical protein ABKN59_011557 [Abortiporus biennis]
MILDCNAWQYFAEYRCPITIPVATLQFSFSNSVNDCIHAPIRTHWACFPSSFHAPRTHEWLTSRDTIIYYSFPPTDIILLSSLTCREECRKILSESPKIRLLKMQSTTSIHECCARHSLRTERFEKKSMAASAILISHIFTPHTLAQMLRRSLNTLVMSDQAHLVTRALHSSSKSLRLESIGSAQMVPIVGYPSTRGGGDELLSLFSKSCCQTLSNILWCKWLHLTS